ncbi:hypothetical protein WJX84_001983 [Apatococcus fuscideae]|uniref:Uncharacterized protein n=1 Tax=Apatococcus fuscideae TaxID=2026836 RepID=A0AAW1T484_9CHLO
MAAFLWSRILEAVDLQRGWRARSRPLPWDLPGAMAARKSVQIAKNLDASLISLKATADQLQQLCMEHEDAGDSVAECARQLNRSSLQCIQAALDKVHCELLCDFVRTVTYHSSNRAVQCPIGMSRRRWFQDHTEPFAAQDNANRLRMARGSMLLIEGEVEAILQGLSKQSSRRISIGRGLRGRQREGRGHHSHELINRWALTVAEGFQKPKRPGVEAREQIYLRTMRPYRAAGSPDVTPRASLFTDLAGSFSEQSYDEPPFVLSRHFNQHVEEFEHGFGDEDEIDDSRSHSSDDETKATLKTNRELQADAEGQEPIMDALMLYIPPSAVHPKSIHGPATELNSPTPPITRASPTSPASRNVTRTASPSTPSRMGHRAAVGTPAIRRSAGSGVAVGAQSAGMSSQATPPLGGPEQLSLAVLSQQLSNLSSPSWGLSALPSPTHAPVGSPLATVSATEFLQLGGVKH